MQSPREAKSPRDAREKMRSSCGRPNDVLLMIALSENKLQSFRNDVSAGDSIRRNYEGSLACMALKVENAANRYPWTGKRTLGVLRFSCERLCQMWFQSDPKVKQPDWLDGVDMIMVPMTKPLSQDKPFFELLNLSCIRDIEGLIMYLQNSEECVQKMGGQVTAVNITKEHEKYCANWPYTFFQHGHYFRGPWHPEGMVLRQWKSKEDYEKFYCSSDYQQLLQLLQGSVEADSLVFEHELLNSPRSTHY